MNKGKEVEQVIFFSPHGRYKINDEENELVIAFKPIREGSGSPGCFSSKDENIIKYMKESKAYGKKFSDKPGFKATIPGFTRDEIIAGIRAAGNNAQLTDAKIAEVEEKAKAEGLALGETAAKASLIPLVKEFGDLKAKCTDAEGKLKPSAKKADVDRINELSGLLGIN